MVGIHAGQGGLKSFLTEIIGKRSKDGAVLRLDFLVCEKILKVMEKEAAECVQRLSNWREDEAQA